MESGNTSSEFFCSDDLFSKGGSNKTVRDRECELGLCLKLLLPFVAQEGGNQDSKDSKGVSCVLQTYGHSNV